MADPLPIGRGLRASLTLWPLLTSFELVQPIFGDVVVALSEVFGVETFFSIGCIKVVCRRWMGRSMGRPLYLIENIYAYRYLSRV